MLKHDRWSSVKNKMIPCSGSGHPPATREQLLKVGFKQVFKK